MIRYTTKVLGSDGRVYDLSREKVPSAKRWFPRDAWTEEDNHDDSPTAGSAARASTRDGSEVGK